MRYYPAKDMLFVAITGFMAVMFALSIHDKTFVASGLLALIIGYLVWMWFDTWYLIADKKLCYHSAAFKGSIDIESIFEIINNKKQYSGIKASLSTKGMIIKYNKWDDVYISPKDAEAFISALKAVNPSIVVK